MIHIPLFLKNKTYVEKKRQTHMVSGASLIYIKIISFCNVL